MVLQKYKLKYVILDIVFIPIFIILGPFLQMINVDILILITETFLNHHNLYNILQTSHHRPIILNKQILAIKLNTLILIWISQNNVQKNYPINNLH